MKVNYWVYKRNDKLHLSLVELPGSETRIRKKSGNEAKIQAITILTGIELPGNVSSGQIKQHIERLYNTPQWGKYLLLVDSIKNESYQEVINNEYQYTIEVELLQEFVINNQVITIRPDSKIVLKTIYEILEKNRAIQKDSPIISLKKI